MSLRTRHFQFGYHLALAFAVLLAGGHRSAHPAEALDNARRAQATNDLNILIETARTAWAYAEDKEEHLRWRNKYG